jgi:uncharacterized membrane protein YhhN
MHTPTLILTLFGFASAGLHIRAEYVGPRAQVYLFKPLTMILIIAVALVAGADNTSTYKVAVVAGLVCSLAGDVFLMLPRDRFIAGLISFLIAHVLYIIAFTSRSGFNASLPALLVLSMYGALMLRCLWSHLGKMRLPVLIYMLVILMMVLQAWESHRLSGQPHAFLAAIGAALFALSDSALALNRFRRPFRSAQAIVLSTYFAAQWLIANSIF